MQIHANPDQDVVVVLNADAPSGRQVVARRRPYAIQ